MNRDSSILIVGVGGIGCELLKTLLLSKLSLSITLVDMDMIQLTNLNRQFLFRKHNADQPKATVAAQVAIAEYKRGGYCGVKEEDENNIPEIIPAVGNIMDKHKFPIEFFRNFTLIFNALDNIEARSYVNRMCLFTKIPLFECGTLGFIGYATKIMPGLTPCFDCYPKHTAKSYPVCTIRLSPTLPIHAIIWAKEWLLAELPEMSNSTHIEIAKKVFITDIVSLVEKKDEVEWEKPPKPLLEDQIYSALELAANEELENHIENVFTLEQNIFVFLKECKSLLNRKSLLMFDKDDTEIMNFISAAANIRSYIFGIPVQTFFKIKSMAGNIIPAVASANAIIAGLVVLSAMKHCENKRDVNNYGQYLSHGGNLKVISAEKLATEPNLECSTCKYSHAIIGFNSAKLKSLTLLEFLTKLKEKLDEDHYLMKSNENEGDEIKFYLMEGSRILADPDSPASQWNKTFDELGISESSIIKVSHDDFDDGDSLMICVTFNKKEKHDHSLKWGIQRNAAKKPQLKKIKTS